VAYIQLSILFIHRSVIVIDKYLSFQGNDHLVCLFFTWVGINIMASNCTKVTPVGISVAGKQPALEIIVWYVEESH
jgi:hypothetical protein